jgi:ferric-dicitrate binding protein FerR (iron transport regulator)
MSAPRFAQLASRVFDRRAESDAPPSAESRLAAISVIEGALRERRRTRRWTRWGLSLASVAACVAAVVGAQRVIGPGPKMLGASGAQAHAVRIVAQSVGGGASVVVSGAEAPLAEGRAIPEGSRLVTPESGQATLAFSTGTTVQLGESTDLTVGGDGAKQVLRLGTGWVDLHVAKLMTAQRFIVDTADTQVEVRGTRFRVSLAKPDPSCGGGTPTRVTVSEGVVAVRHDGVEARVTAGQQWPEGCGHAVTVANPQVATGPTPASVGVTVPISTLSEQNDLFARAVSSMHQGDARGAIAGFDRFLAKFPGGANAQDAAAHRMHLLRSVSTPRALSAAKQYLSMYPGGYARAEAEAIVLGSP